MKRLAQWLRRLPVDTAMIEQAIARLERQTSAELRVVVERKTKADCAIARAEQLFSELKMEQTAARNGVLLYLCFKPHYIAIIGDQAIHQKVGEAFWQSVYQAMKTACQNANYTQAICQGIEQVGVQLAQHFPHHAQDIDELPNEVVIK